MNQTAFQKARQEISARRISAQVEQEKRCQEIEKKIPEISEINHKLSQSIFSILNGEDIEAVRKRNLEAQQYCSRILVSHGYPGDYLDLHYTCRNCNDTGYAENGQYCSCLTKLVAFHAVEDMHEQSQIRLCTFEEFSLEYYKDHACYADMKKILDACQKYAFNFSQHSPSMLFFGNVGTGKTHLSLSIVSEVLKKGYHVIYDSVGNLLTKIENEHFRNSNPEISTLKLLLNTDLLVLDDLGTEFDSSFALSVIYTIINTRINKNLPTIISTNLDQDEITNIYEKRITSRLFAVYDVKKFNGIDIRQKKKEQNESAF